jgi:O-methyltransferase involved in polyketide biosynthesis
MGFRTDRPAFFAMLGVAIFMPTKAVTRILHVVSALPQGSGIVLDYGILDSSLNEKERAVRELAAQNAAAIGEPFVTFFDPGKLRADLWAMGFRHIDDCGYAAINQRYFESRSDALRLEPSGRHLMAAYF